MGLHMNGGTAGSHADTPAPARLVRRARGGWSLALATPLLLLFVLAGCTTAVALGSPGATAAPSASPTASSVGASPDATASPGTSASGPVAVSAGAQDLQQQFVDVVTAVQPSVVEIETSTGLGSGIVYDAQGDIVTNAHVVDGATKFTVTLADGRQIPGTLVGTFAPDDVAVIHILATSLKPAVFGDSSKLAVGSIVLALGNPLGLQSSATQGMVSAVGRTVTEENENALPNVIQTTAPINPGNSGGALVDLTGAVVGIPTLAASDPQLGGAAAGIGFAISSNRVVFIADQLITSGKVLKSGRAYLGISTADLAAGGVLVRKVTAGGPAALAGIKVGDAIVAVNEQPTPDGGTLSEVLVDFQPGDKVTVSVIRSDGKKATITAVLGEYPG
jgi:putative serine protease PepD